MAMRWVYHLAALVQCIVVYSYGHQQLQFESSNLIKKMLNDYQIVELPLRRTACGTLCISFRFGSLTSYYNLVQCSPLWQCFSKIVLKLNIVLCKETVKKCKIKNDWFDMNTVDGTQSDIIAMWHEIQTFQSFSQFSTWQNTRSIAIAKHGCYCLSIKIKKKFVIQMTIILALLQRHSFPRIWTALKRITSVILHLFNGDEMKM